jgi:hypothetical protein
MATGAALRGLFILLFLLALLVAGEVAMRRGRRLRGTLDDPQRSQFTTVEAGMLSLLGLLLGFTFSMTVTRYDARRLLLVDDANAIGTAYLRAGALPDPAKAEVRRLLRAYVEVRIQLYDAGDDPVRLARAVDASEELQVRFWTRAVQEARQQPGAITLGILLQALNTVIDLHASRLEALQNRVPAVILVLLTFLAIVSLAMVGYAFGVSGRRSSLTRTLLAVMVTAVVLVIIDLDRPYTGFIRVSQAPMLSLRQSLPRYP